MSIVNNISEVQQKISAAAARAGRSSKDITLLAVSKTVPEDRIMEAHRAGLRAFGENKVQEWQAKHLSLPQDCQWHIIGRLQTNKVKYLEDIAFIHSLDRFALLEKLNLEGEKRQIRWKTLVQVNVARDKAKAGLEIEELQDFMDSVHDFPYVTVHGLMTIGALDAGPGETRGYFRKLREIRNDLLTKGAGGPNGLPHLSMGMSQDYEIAVEEGSTIVRVGSMIFGHRN
ncbi:MULTISPECIES: YggS family pyridoxal phosphate-dependent enzyme [unclassified Dehalobacter]|uniref:YggS family pyridoxal phosphate-dependent enzyme n=1 Tax=unclassified Dehalobacter TaxID=2635733 RepID=UPI00037D97F0|nr:MULTISPECIES: YggS family pyridoxal phosphate-dependent enzyme [unclassified Dehalobacter]RJE49056.1 YggS family pyridoxal phosphate enzyme [Dehalobacter sp. MCB1]TCX51795.1 YggS family pyridoxal phosphate-dependent enzyme [Dehalobacter sp. 14DCB1]TCX52855.1 YggS family pyridoxal phosphate-dependent enzyme [Dehalobacter sp. 12DCB1]